MIGLEHVHALIYRQMQRAQPVNAFCCLLEPELTVGMTASYLQPLKPVLQGPGLPALCFSFPSKGCLLCKPLFLRVPELPQGRLQRAANMAMLALHRLTGVVNRFQSRPIKSTG